jgi:hypothetical protein
LHAVDIEVDRLRVFVAAFTSCKYPGITIAPIIAAAIASIPTAIVRVFV